MKFRNSLLLLLLVLGLESTVLGKGKILVVLSSENKITLKNNIIHETGFFLPELMVPLKRLVDAGYTPVFANPRSTLPVMDKVSDSAFWFGGVEEEYKKMRTLCVSLGLCGTGTVGTLKPKKLSLVRKEGLDEYAGLLLPGGHAPMEDLWKDRDLGEILKVFHDAKTRRPTAMICHGPIALLSALNNPEGYIQALMKDNRKKVTELSKGWIYKDYTVAVFTTREEQQEEPGADNVLGGYVRFYPDEALERAGVHVARANKWQSQVAQHEELITAQNPSSDKAFAEAFLKALDSRPGTHTN